MPGTKDVIKTTCPRDCYDACGIAVIRRAGAVTKVVGDPDHPVSRGALCGKCALAYNGAWRDPAARLTRPLRRAGPKGTDRFEPVSWEVALSEIAARLKDIVADAGPESVLSTHYTGTCSLIATNFPNRFFNRLGATDVEPDTVCNNAGHVALNYLYGTSLTGFDPRTAKDSASILVWGCNPSATAPHAHKHWLPESPATKVVIDPIRHETAAAADIHLQLRPGSDAALAFAMLHVMRREGLLDRAFIDRHTVGYAELEPLIEGATPAWAAAETGLAVADIERVARLYGSGPSLLWLGQGLQRQSHGGNVFRAVGLLPALTGNIGKPGAGLYYLNGKAATRDFDMAYLAQPGLRRNKATPLSHMDLADRLEDERGCRALFSWNMNIAASAPNQLRLREAMLREDLLTVVVDLFMTDTAQLADYVLPAASFLEFDDLVGSYFHLSVGAQAKVMEPIGEALPNQEIFRRLSRAMGYAEPELYESDRSLIDYELARSGVGIAFEALKQRGTVPWRDDVVILHRELTFATPSGRIELASAAADAAGHGRLPRPEADPRPAQGWLRLLSPASKWLMNSSYHNDAKVAAQLRERTVAIHPAEARARGLNDGERVLVRNRHAALLMRLLVSDTVPVGCALSHKSRWPQLERDQANVNVLNPALRTDMGDSTALHSVEVELVRAA